VVLVQLPQLTFQLRLRQWAILGKVVEVVALGLELVWQCPQQQKPSRTLGGRRLNQKVLGTSLFQTFKGVCSYYVAKNVT